MTSEAGGGFLLHFMNHVWTVRWLPEDELGYWGLEKLRDGSRLEGQVPTSSTCYPM